MNKDMTQEDLVLNFLKNRGTITQREANISLSVSRLAAIIYKLRHHYGHKINAKTITVKNQFGKKCHVAEYHLDEA